MVRFFRKGPVIPPNYAFHVNASDWPVKQSLKAAQNTGPSFADTGIDFTVRWKVLVCDGETHGATFIPSGLPRTVMCSPFGACLEVPVSA